MQTRTKTRSVRHARVASLSENREQINYLVWLSTAVLIAGVAMSCAGKAFGQEGIVGGSNRIRCGSGCGENQITCTPPANLEKFLAGTCGASLSPFICKAAGNDCIDTLSEFNQLATRRQSEKNNSSGSNPYAGGSVDLSKKRQELQEEKKRLQQSIANAECAGKPGCSEINLAKTRLEDITQQEKQIEAQQKLEETELNNAVAENRKQFDDYKNQQLLEIKTRPNTDPNAERAEDVAQPEDSCATSTGIDKKYTCNGTKTLVTTAATSNLLTQTAGSMAVQVMGANASLAAAQSQSQSQALRSAASTQQTTGNMQLGLGAMNAAMGVMQVYQGSGHADKAEEIGKRVTGQKVKAARNDNTNSTGRDSKDDGYISHQDLMTNGLVQRFRGETFEYVQADQSLKNSTAPGARELYLAQKKKRDEQVAATEGKINRDLQRTGSRAQGEQTSMADQAKIGGITSMMIGAQQLIGGFFNVKAAKEQKKAADELSKLENMPAFVAPPQADALGTGANATAPRVGSAITGNGVVQDPSTQALTATPDGLNDVSGFGKPIGVEPLDRNVQGPTPGKMKDGAAPPGPGGSAPGGIGSGNTAAAPKDADAQPQATSLEQAGGRMEQGGGGGGYASAGGGGGAGNTNPSIDLAGMMKDLLTKEKEQNPSGTSITQFADRTPASGDAGGLVLPREDNIFRHVSEAYSVQVKQGKVGI